MDAIKNALSGNKSTEKSTTSNQATGSTGQQDYGDKAFSALNKKEGWGLDDKKSESITDGARSAYEKVTGSKVDSKYSN